jgi:hypothetical protein
LDDGVPLLLDELLGVEVEARSKNVHGKPEFSNNKIS